MRGKMLGSTDDQPPTASTDDQPPSPYEKHLITEEQHLQSPLVYKEKHVGENNRNDAQQQPGKNNAFCSDEKEKSRSSIIINENYYSGGNNLLLGAAPRKKSTRRLSWADRKSEEQTQGESFLTDELESKGVRTRRRSNVSLISSNSSAQSNDGMPMRRILKVTKRGSGSSSGMGSSLKSNPHGSSSNSTTIPRLSTSTPLGCMKDDDIDQVVIEQKKSRAIWCLRTLTITTLTTAAVIVAFLTYTTSRNSELQVFNTQYEDSVVKVAEAISSDINNKLNSAMSFSAMYTSRYGSKNNWPNVTMPYFEEQAKGLLDTSGGIALSFNPIITNVTRTEWEAHAVESAYIFGAEQLVSRSCDTCRIVADGIFRRTNGKIVDDPGYSPESRNPYVMVPVWQIYPTKVNWRAVMFNLHSEKYRQDALDDMLQHKVPTLTGLLHLVQHDEMDPSSILFYPVMDRFNSSRFFKNVVGSISIVFTWGDILKSVLPGYIKGLIVVLEKRAPNEEDPQVFTYSISGDVVTLLGDGDLHDPRYDQYEHIVNTNVAQGAENLANIDVLVRYRLLIYPSKELQYSYLTFKPIAMTFIVLALFVFTSAVFLFYDYLVYNRQNAIMKFAQRSGHIVNSLFPSGVRERLFSSTDQQLGNHSILDKKYTEDETEKEESGELLAHPQQKRNPAHHIKQFLKSSFNRSDTVVNHNNDGRSYIQNTPPIADLFPNSSILFADIVSFTSWSSEHAPEDVFYLLETLFLEFDKTAERMGVFKLGTIGEENKSYHSFDHILVSFTYFC